MYLFKTDNKKWKIAEGNAQTVDSWDDYYEARDKMIELEKMERESDSENEIETDIDWE